MSINEEISCGGVIGTEQIAALLIRYWGIGTELTSDESEILLFALTLENKGLGGQIHRLAESKFKRKFPKVENAS